MADWRDRAACAGMPTGLFFHERGEPTEEAKAACGRCPVRPDCLAYALEAGVHHGVWGGKSERERRRMLRGTVRPPVEYDTKRKVAS